MLKMSREDVEQCPMYMTVLHQRKWWRNGYGTVVRRREMHIQYKLNALAYLIRESRRIVNDYALSPAFVNCPDVVEEQLGAMVADPEKAVLDTPMARALLQDIMSFADIGPEDLGLVLVNNVGIIDMASVVSADGVSQMRKTMGVGSVWAEKR